MEAHQWHGVVLALFQQVIIDADIYDTGVNLVRKDVRIGSISRRDTSVQFQLNTGSTLDISSKLTSFLTDSSSSGFVFAMNAKCARIGKSFHITGVSDVSVSIIAGTETSSAAGATSGQADGSGLLVGAVVVAGLAMLAAGAYFAVQVFHKNPTTDPLSNHLRLDGSSSGSDDDAETSKDFNKAEPDTVADVIVVDVPRSKVLPDEQSPPAYPGSKEQV